MSLLAKLESKGWRFLLAGGVNTFFGWVVYSCSVLLGAPIWLALIISTVAGVAFNFLTIGGFVFRELSMQKVPKFVAAYVTVYLVNLLALRLFKPMVADPVWAQFILTPVMAGLSFVLMSYWVFPASKAD